MKTDEARAMGMAYVWGRQDAGESERDTGFSIHFGEAYALRAEAYNTERTWSMIPLQSAWDEWQATKCLTYKTRDGYREIGLGHPEGHPSDLRVIETVSAGPEFWERPEYTRRAGPTRVTL